MRSSRRVRGWLLNAPGSVPRIGDPAASCRVPGGRRKALGDPPFAYCGDREAEHRKRLVTRRDGSRHRSGRNATEMFPSSAAPRRVCADAPEPWVL